MVKRTTNAPPPVPTVGNGRFIPPPRIDAKTAASRLGPALFGDKWIPELTLHEEWLIEQGKINDEPTDKAENRQQLMEFQHRKVGDWLTKRGIRYLWEFERAFADEFPDSRTTKANSPPLAATPAAAREQNATRSSAKRRRAHNKIDDNAALKRMEAALRAGEVSSPNHAALIEAKKLTKEQSGKAVAAAQRRLKGKFKEAFPNGWRH
jgi:hypothetical protein